MVTRGASDLLYNPGMSTAKRIIVLTGATRGLGRSLVAPFAAAGHTVLGCGRSRKRVARPT